MRQMFRRPSPAMVVAIVALVTALGGGAYAASRVDTKDIAKQAVTGSKIAPNAVKGKKVRDDSLSGAKINENSLGEVPLAANATNANTAQNLNGYKPFFIKMAYGESQRIEQNGSVALDAHCDQVGGNDRIRILASSTEDGAMLKSDEDNLLGPGQAGAPGFLGPNTPESNREFVEETDTTGQTTAFFQLDGGYVVGPDSRMIAVEEEGLLLAVNYLGTNCVVAGFAQTLNG